MFRVLTKCHFTSIFPGIFRHCPQVINVGVVDPFCYNFKLSDKQLIFNMPPKRKAPTTTTTTTEKADSTTDIVKTNKRGKKAELETNGIQNEDEQVSSPPKRSRPVRSTKTVVSYDESKTPAKPKKVPRSEKTLKIDKASTTSKSPQPGPSWRVSPDNLPEDHVTLRRPKKEKAQKSAEKIEKLEKSKLKKETVKTKKTKPEENLQNEDSDEKEKSKTKKAKPKAVEENLQNGDDKMETVKTKKTKPDENLQNGEAEKKEKSRTKKAKPKAVEENIQNGDVEMETVKIKKTNSDENLQNENVVEKEKSKTKKAKPKAVEENLQNDEEKTNEPKVKELQNKTDTIWNDIDFSCHAKNGFGVKHNLIISTWNVGGLKSWVKKGCMEYLKHERPDILCMQETKCTKEKLPEELSQLKDYHQYWCSSNKEGYAGVGLLSVKEPENVTYGIDNEDQDIEGRCITAEFDKFYLVNVYVPNAGRKLVTMPKRLEWNKAFKKYVKELEEKKPVIICGDMNVSHNAIDLARPQSNTKSAGFTQEEREGMTELLTDGFVDVYRHLYPDQKDVYSFWTYMSNSRAKNVGWRLDYFIVSEEMIKGVSDVVYRTEVFGSDHCPVTIFINI